MAFPLRGFGKIGQLQDKDALCELIESQLALKIVVYIFDCAACINKRSGNTLLFMTFFIVKLLESLF